MAGIIQKNLLAIRCPLVDCETSVHEFTAELLRINSDEQSRFQLVAWILNKINKDLLSSLREGDDVKNSEYES